MPKTRLEGYDKRKRYIALRKTSGCIYFSKESTVALGGWRYCVHATMPVVSASVLRALLHLQS